MRHVQSIGVAGSCRALCVWVINVAKRIPIKSAREIAEKHGLRQVLLIGFDGENVHLVTYGKTKKDCEQAATAQDFWSGRIREFSFVGQAEKSDD